jgi:PAS domain S-box-containing protein
MKFKSFPWQSFKTKMTLFTLVIFLMGIWSLEFYTSKMLRKDMQQMLADQQFATVSLLAAQVNEELKERLESLQLLSEQIGPELLHNPTAVQTALEHSPILQNLFNYGTFVTGIDGTVVASFSKWIDRTGLNFIDRDYISTALKDGKSNIGKPVKGKLTQDPLFSIAVPIRDKNDKVIGALVGTTDLSKPNFIDKITDRRYGKTGGYFLVAPQYRLIVTASDKTRIMQEFPAPGVVPAIDRFLQGYEESSIYVNPLGIEVLGTIKNIPVAGWFLGAILPTEEAFAPVRSTQQRMLIAAGILTILAGCLTWWMTLRMLQNHLAPMLAATKILTSMSAANQFPHTLPVTDQDEIGNLVSGFNRLLENLAQREESLRKSEEKFRTVANYIHDWEYWRAPDGGLVYVSPSCERVTGYTAEEFIHDPELLMRIIHPDDCQKFQQHIIDLKKNTESSKCQTLEFSIYTRNGDKRAIEHICKEVFDQEGKSLGRRVSNRDITERKDADNSLRESEGTLRQIVNVMPIGLWLLDKNGQIVNGNRTGQQIWGGAKYVGPERYGEYKGWWLSTGKLIAAEEWGASRAIRKGEISIDEEIEIECFDGSHKIILHSAVPLFNEQHTLTGAIVINQDITERKRAEEERRNMQKQLVQAQKMESIGTLAGGIAHDFNNILGAILGYAEMAYEDSLSGSVQPTDLVQVIEASGRARDLVKQILSFSRQAENLKIPLRPTPLVKESIKLLRSSIPKTIDIQLDIETETGLIQADPTQIHQIIINLCTNAYHSMEEDGGILYISLKNKEVSARDAAALPDVRPGHFIQLIVKDTGPGIAPEVQERIFEPYFTTKEVGKGTGMGLAIVHGIVKDYGGFILCNSKIGKGTVFEVCLPTLLEQIALETQEVELTPVGTERILFIDDEEILANMGRAMLERLGYTVTMKMGSIEALACFKAQPDAFDLVITDQTMPEMAGFDLARRILQIRPGMPIILCTGYSNQISEEKAKSFGIKGFAMKPLARRDIAGLIRKILDERQAGNGLV